MVNLNQTGAAMEEPPPDNDQIT